MANPGPNLVNPLAQRMTAIVSVPVGGATFTTPSTEVTYTVNGLAVGDYVSICAPAGFGSTGIGISNARVSAANTLAILYTGGTSGTVPTDTYLVEAVRSFPVVSDFGITKFNNFGVVAGSNP